MNGKPSPGLAAAGRVIEKISAITLETADMARSVRFYTALGFTIRYGGEDAAFTSFVVGDGYLNLELNRDFAGGRGWGRSIFYVSDVDALYERTELRPVAFNGATRCRVG